jgi:hypothetical protein
MCLCPDGCRPYAQLSKEIIVLCFPEVTVFSTLASLVHVAIINEVCFHLHT